MKHFDVIVVGMGTAGVFAALAAAGRGMAVLALEKTTACGGMGTNGGIAPYYDGSSLELVSGLDSKALSMQEESGFLLPLKKGCASTELLKGILEKSLLGNGVELRYQAVVTGVRKKGRRVTGLHWHDAKGSHAATASVCIDATADGALLALAGAEFLPAGRMDGRRQPYARLYSYLESGKLWNYGGDAGYVNQDDPFQFTAECLKSAAAQIPRRFREEDKRFAYAPLLGAREGRHLRGRDTVCFRDVIRGIQATHPVGWEYANFDTHSIDLMFEEDDVYLYAVAAMQWETKLYWGVPAGALIPAGLEGILAAGRMLSADHAASQAVRMKGCMKHLGAAAGILAALAVQRGIDVSAVSSAEITELLPLRLQREKAGGNADVWLKEPERIRQVLRSARPGTAIWSAYLLGKCEYLLPLLEENGFARAHAAFALALLRDARALPVLRELASRRDMTMSETSRNEPIRESHGAIATYLLGYLKDRESIPLLCEIFREKRDFFFAATAWKALLNLSRSGGKWQNKIVGILRDFAKGQAGIPPFRCYCGEKCDVTEQMRQMTRSHLRAYAEPAKRK